ncbi:hypothetical protein ACVWYF_001603 [Hymenobacter sp. UYAg731]
MRWRCRTARVRTAVLPLATGARHAPSLAAWRRTQPVVMPPIPISLMLQVGRYLVGAEGDPQLSGHPDIRY